MPVPQRLLSRNRLVLLAALTTLGLHAHAQEEDDGPFMLGPFELSAELGIVSDYIDRGITASDHDPAVQGGLTLALPVGEGGTAVYLGAWGSTVDFDEEGDGPVEIELFTGVYGAFGETGADWDVWASYYRYPGARSSLDYDYAELAARLGYALTDDLRLEGGYVFSPDHSGSSGLAHYVDTGLAYDLPLELPLPLTVDGTLGRQWFESNSSTGLEDYLDWSLGITATWRMLDLGIRYTATDLGSSDCFGGTSACDTRVVFSVLARF